MFSLVVGSDFLQSINKDFESVLTFLSMDRVELGIDFFGNGFTEFTSTIQEASVLDVKVNVAKAKSGESQYKEDF